MKLKRCFAVLLAVTLVFSLITPLRQASAASDPISISAKASILVDAASGKILYGNNIDEQLPVASMAKAMTEYLVLESIHKGKIKWDQTYTPDEYVYKISQIRGLSNVPLRRDGSYTVRELYEAMAIYSANGAAIALAEVIAGSETNFIKMMNDKAKQLGLKRYEFVNATGLENSDLMGMQPEGTTADQENTMSARDMALLSQRLITDYPEMIETASISRKTFKEGTDMPNYNWMLKGLIYEYPGVDGLKTGSTSSAGSCFTATAKRGNMRVISVVLNATDGTGDIKTPRFKETKKLLDYAFNNFTVEQLFPKNYQSKKQPTVPVVDGKGKEVAIQTNAPVEMAMHKGEKENYEPKLIIDKSKLNDKGELSAPVKKGAKVGVMSVEYKGKEKQYGYLTGSNAGQADVVTKDSVEKANWFVLMMRGIGGFFAGIWNGATSGIQGWFK
ncbi:D-alanyl-D-alanine carboxypeptidase [Metabacillus sp. GX 13764]|nr:D-alanyl-D-alanine carboxypeptidase [Metabacillus kandeliae]